VPKRRSAKSPEPRSRGTREETTTRILDAALELFSARNPRDVTVRDVAQKAGVTHALVHQYVGSKDDLLNAVMQRVTTNRVALVSKSPSLDDALQALLRQVLTDRLHAQAQIRSAMDGIEYVSLKDRLETGAALIELAQRTAASQIAKPIPTPRDVDPRVVLAAVSALAACMSAADTWLYEIFQLDPAGSARSWPISRI
jgi:AcrR family transcriptional regulator